MIEHLKLTRAETRVFLDDRLIKCREYHDIIGPISHLYVIDDAGNDLGIAIVETGFDQKIIDGIMHMYFTSVKLERLFGAIGVKVQE